jgi:hypothetical protein
MRRLRVGVLELLVPEARCSPIERIYTSLLTRQYAGIMSQSVSAWCRRLGHETFYAAYRGQADPRSLLPTDLDVVFISAYTQASALAYALGKLFRRDGTQTVLGGAHAKSFPEDALRFFDVVVRECDATLVDEILRDRPVGEILTSGRRLLDFPSAEERLPELRVANFLGGRAVLTSVVPLLTSVGCPYACDFCTDWDNPHSLLPLDRLEEDLRFISSRLPHAMLAFQDANFGVAIDAVLEVLTRIPPRRRNSYLMESSLSILRGPRLARLRDTRCLYVAPGIESWTDYSDKSSGRGRRGEDKLDWVIAQFDQIYRHVPGLQANFLFGGEDDRGEESVELTKVFMSRAPRVWPTVNVVTPFGGTPLYDRYRTESRLIEALPLAFYYTPYLAVALPGDDLEACYARLVDLLEHMTSSRLLAARLRAARGWFRPAMLLRTRSQQPVLGELRSILARLRTDRQFRAFHEGDTDVLPRFYAERFDRLLGPYAQLLSPAERRPMLPPPRAVAGEPLKPARSGGAGAVH